MEYIKIKSSKRDSDFNDTFLKEDVEEEMKDVGCEISDDTDWIDYVFGHMFVGIVDDDTPINALLQFIDEAKPASINTVISVDGEKVLISIM